MGWGWPNGGVGWPLVGGLGGFFLVGWWVGPQLVGWLVVQKRGEFFEKRGAWLKSSSLIKA